MNQSAIVRLSKNRGAAGVALGLQLLVLNVGARPQSTQPQPNTLSSAEKKDGWKLLFDGKTFAGWRSYTAPGSLPAGSWSIEDGCIKNAKGNGRPGSGGGDIITAEQFTDFDLSFEWRIGVGGNSGVKYFVLDRQGSAGAKLYQGDDGRSAVGHEYQLLDDERHPDAKNGPIRQTGSLYSLIPPKSSKKVKPVVNSISLVSWFKASTWST